MSIDTENALRAAIIARPDVVLDDTDVMRALVAANDRALGDNIVDLRGIAMDRLETRLDRLEDTHRSVIAAAYENLAGTNKVHRAILRLLEPLDFEVFLDVLKTDIAEILRVDAIRLVLASNQKQNEDALSQASDVLVIRSAAEVGAYLTLGRGGPGRKIALRQVATGAQIIYGNMAHHIRSEACLKLDLGPGRLPALLVLGAEDQHMFGPHQAADLLEFFGGTFERVMRRWLA